MRGCDMSGMRFPCRVTQSGSGAWSVQCSSDPGPVEVSAPTRAQALEKMRRELRYRLELCPCTGERYKDLEIELVEQ